MPGQPPETTVASWGGIKDGKKRQHGETKNRPGPKGKPNTKAFVDAHNNAIFNADRLIRKKIEEGYVEIGLDGRPLIGGHVEDPVYDAGKTIPFDDFLPKNLCFSKPKNTVSPKFLAKLEAENNIILTRKLNGMLVVAQITDDGDPHLYTRRMDVLDQHFPHLRDALVDMKCPPHSILLFEAFLGEGNKKKDLLRVQSVMRSKPEKARLRQADDEWMKFYLIRVPVWKGEYLEQDKTCEELCFLIENTFTDMLIEYRDEKNERFLFPLEVYEMPVADAIDEAKSRGYEGWVGYKRNAKFENYSFSLHGKPDRPSCCFKLKPEYEDDFIAYFNPQEGTKDFPQGSMGSGKNTGLMGTLSLYQRDPHSDKTVYICEVGSGFTDAQRKKMTKAEYPLVATVKYTSRQYISEGDDTNALEFPRFDQIHPDKDDAEVYNPKIQSA